MPRARIGTLLLGVGSIVAGSTVCLKVRSYLQTLSDNASHQFVQTTACPSFYYRDVCVNYQIHLIVLVTDNLQT